MRRKLITLCVTALLILTFPFTVKAIPGLCQGAGRSACALTDTKLVSGCAEFSEVMPKNMLQPFIGI